MSQIYAFRSGPLSQWYSSPFYVDGIFYLTAEHWMMAEKARLFGDATALVRILAARTPRTAKVIGRGIRGFNEQMWSQIRESVVVRGNLTKFRTHPNLRRILLNTGDRILAEAAPWDLIWGTGLSVHDTLAIPPKGWPGKNLLGYCLMRVRTILRKEPELHTTNTAFANNR